MQVFSNNFYDSKKSGNTVVITHLNKHGPNKNLIMESFFCWKELNLNINGQTWKERLLWPVFCLPSAWKASCIWWCFVQYRERRKARVLSHLWWSKSRRLAFLYFKTIMSRIDKAKLKRQTGSYLDWGAGVNHVFGLSVGQAQRYNARHCDRSGSHFA